jgi:transcriptional/translational regulatory protein YebC/TACO1
LNEKLKVCLKIKIGNTLIGAGLNQILPATVPVNDEQSADISKLIEKPEQDDDVQKVFHNMG